MRRGGAEREEREFQAVSVLSAEPDVGLEPTNHEIMTWAETKSWMLNQLSHPGAPEEVFLKKCFTCFIQLWN